MSGEKPQFIQPPSQLKDKVSVTHDGVDLEALEQAEKLIAGMQDSYLEWVEEDLAKLQSLYDAAEKAEGDDRRKLLDGIFAVAHDVKGQGGSFDYPLMTVIGNQLCRFIEKQEGEVKASHMAVVKVHIDALRVVISQRMSGDGGKTGDGLVRGLNAAVAKTMGKG